jgi:hypothetical protein
VIVKDQEGREITLLVRGNHEEPQIDEAQFVDSDDDVPDSTIEWIYSYYAEELSDEAHQYNVGRAEAIYDAYKDGTYE